LDFLKKNNDKDTLDLKKSVGEETNLHIRQRLFNNLRNKALIKYYDLIKKKKIKK